MIPYTTGFRRDARGMPAPASCAGYRPMRERSYSGVSWPVWPSSARSRAVRRFGDGWAAKRACDIAAGCAGCLLLGVLLPVVGLAVWLDLGWPIMHRQVRVGQDGRRFTMIKFRTMRRDAERGGPAWAHADDPRASRLGRLLRRSHLDELPQFWNVLRGDMSLVGPRPERPEFVEQLAAQIPRYRQRLAVRPGLTGWAQVHYRYDASVQDAAEKLGYDLYYVAHRGLLLDLSIVARTVRHLLRLNGR